MEASKSLKVYVPVKAAFDAEGRLIPTELTWENGHKYAIDRVTDVRQAAAMKSGGQGDRYTIWVNGKQSFLFFERSTKNSGSSLGRWFVQRRSN